jgi:uroporphyrinogen-III synthase
MSIVIIVRPEPGAKESVERARDMGLDAVACPLFTLHTIPWSSPEPGAFDAVLVTSSNAMSLGGPDLKRFHPLPLFAVGTASANAARACGFTHVIAGSGDGAALIEMAAHAGHTRLLHLAGREHKPLAYQNVTVTTLIVYAADALEPSPTLIAALSSSAIIAVHSPRAARMIGEIVTDRSTLSIAAISDATADAAGTGWARIQVADTPNDRSLLELALRLCDQDSVTFSGY